MVKSKAPLRDALINLIETANPEPVAELVTLGLADTVLEGVLAVGFVNGEVIFFECAECPKWQRVGFKKLKQKVDSVKGRL